MARGKELALGLAGSVALGWWYLAPFLLSLLASPLLLAPSVRKKLSIVLRTLPRDLQFVSRGVRSILHIKLIQWRNLCVADVFDERVRAHPQKVLMHFNGQDWTFQKVSDYSCRVANAFESLGYRRGDVVALYMHNCPEYVCLWMGLSRLGVIVALINHNQRDAALTHSLKIADCRAVLFGADLAQAVFEVKDKLERDVELLQLGQHPAAPGEGVHDLQRLLDEAPTTMPRAPRPGYKDTLMYIYTSGTTGLPKAAKILHSRYIAAGKMLPVIMGMNKDDVVYNALPLYHSAGGMLAIGYGLLFGLTVVLRPKFSASAFIPDCIKHKCTVVQYIGEICRYVLATPPQPSDTQHSLRLMVGNGMREGVWRDFVDRFKVPGVIEIYGSTEGNVSFFNIDHTIGAVGFMPRILGSLLPIAIVRVDQETGDVVRNADGLCERCDIDEPGMLVGEISDSDPSREYHGYLGDNSASEKKILRDVFARGDKWFMSGDILVMDELGYLYFRDRIGDTFRWKGENVSTAEVESAIVAIVGQTDVSVYGVEVAGSEGRAGMAAIADPTGGLDLDALAQGLDRQLPTYARPLFIRKAKALETTGTFKIVKVSLRKEGYDPALVSDPLYFRQGRSYVPLTPEVFQDISSGKVRL